MKNILLIGGSYGIGLALTKTLQNTNNVGAKKSVRLLENQTIDTIIGMSGGGIVKLNDNYLQNLDLSGKPTENLKQK